MSRYISAMVITIIAMGALIMKIIVMAPAFFEFGEAVNETAYDMFTGSVLTRWNSNYALGKNVFWGLMFILVIGIGIYLYAWANRKEYTVMFR